MEGDSTRPQNKNTQTAYSGGNKSWTLSVLPEITIHIDSSASQTFCHRRLGTLRSVTTESVESGSRRPQRTVLCELSCSCQLKQSSLVLFGEESNFAEGKVHISGKKGSGSSRGDQGICPDTTHGFQPRQHSNPEKKAQRVVIFMKMRTVQKIWCLLGTRDTWITVSSDFWWTEVFNLMRSKLSLVFIITAFLFKKSSHIPSPKSLCCQSLF